VSGSGRIAVVGAGPAGLAAAFRLARAGAVPVVFEARSAAGGRARTDDVDGWRVDAAVQLVGSTYTTFLSLLREAGGAALAVRSPGRDALWAGGAAHEVVYGSAASVLASGALPLGLKMRMGATYLPFLARHARELTPHAPERAADAGLDRESVAAWAVHHGGRDLVDRLAHPMLASYQGVTPEETSAAVFHTLARGGIGVEVFALHGGVSAWADCLCRAARGMGGEVRTSVPVHAVRPDGAGVVVSHAGGEERFDAAIVATPAPVARDVIGDHPAHPWLSAVSIRPTVTLALLLDHPVGVRWFGLSFARGESKATAAVCVQENKAPGLVPPGKGLLVLTPLPSAGARLADAEPRAVYDALMPDVLRALPGIDRAVRRVKLYRWPHGWTLFPPGSLARLKDARLPAFEGDGRIALAGEYLYAPTVEGAAHSGVMAAERVLRRVSRAGR
jgi:oxygen-dependent protoporphyrinogen oxidase